jgi:type IV pilus assembly protein PilA
MKRSQGFTLIELMVVVAIIAILAAIALPAYLDYVARAQVSEGFSLATDARTAVTVYHAEHNGYPSGNTAAGLSAPGSIIGKYVVSVTVGDGNGHVEVEFGNDASQKISGRTLSMLLQDEGGSLHWSCTGLDARYLPSACR